MNKDQNNLSDEHMNGAHFEAYYKEMSLLPQKKITKKRYNWIPTFSAFMAGILVVGGLSVYADRSNLFTGGRAQASHSPDQPYHINLATAKFSSGESNIASIYAEASESVVKIENYSEQQSYGLDQSSLWKLFGQQYGMPQGEQAPETEEIYPDETSTGEIDSSNLVLSGTGTGFIVDEKGYIVTNAHVIEGAKQVKVTINGYDVPVTATVVRSDTKLDIAVLKVDTEKAPRLKALQLGNSDHTEIGEWVLAIGNPYGYDQTLTIGVISARERPITIQDSYGEAQVYEHMLQTDASINPGNSGGPLLNEACQVVGMNTAVNAEAQGIGFAIPASVIIDFINAIEII